MTPMYVSHLMHFISKMVFFFLESVPYGSFIAIMSSPTCHEYVCLLRSFIATFSTTLDLAVSCASYKSNFQVINIPF